MGLGGGNGLRIGTGALKRGVSEGDGNSRSFLNKPLAEANVDSPGRRDRDGREDLLLGLTDDNDMLFTLNCGQL